MSVFAELADGRRLEFPDGTDPTVIQKTVKNIVSQQQARKPVQPQQPETLVDKAALATDKVLSGLGKYVPDFLPSRQNIVDAATGASGLMRGTANQIGNLAGVDKAGEKIWPSTESTHGGFETAGRMLDPVALAIGARATYHPVLGNGLKQGLMALGKNAAAGAATGGTIGLLSDQGTGKEGTEMGALLSLLGPGAELAGKAGSAIKNVVDPWLPGGIERAASKTLNKLSGAKRAEILQALDNPDQFVPGSPMTAGEAAAKAGNAEFSGLETALKPTQPTAYDQIAQAKNSARMALLQGIGKDTTAERAAVTNPMREAAIGNANIAGQKLPGLLDAEAQKRASMVSAMQNKGQLQTEAAQQGVLSQGGAIEPRLGGTGNPSLPPLAENTNRVPEYLNGASDFATVEAQRRAQAAFAKTQADSLAAHGNFPLESASVLGQLDKTLSTPGIRASDVVQHALGKVREKIASLTNSNGVIDANDLYTIRKESGNVINQFAKETGNFDKRLTASLQRDVQGYIDDAINKAAGSSNGVPLWSGYLSKYAELSKPKDQRIVAQLLEDKLQPVLNDFGAELPQRGAIYSAALQDAKDATSVSGRLRWNSMEPQQVQQLDNLGRDIGRQTENARLGRLGSAKAREILGQVEPPLPSAGMFNPKYSMVRAASNRLHGLAQGKAIELLAEKMQTPKGASDLMKLTPQQRQAMIDFLTKYQPAMTAGMVSATQGGSQ